MGVYNLDHLFFYAWGVNDAACNHINMNMYIHTSTPIYSSKRQWLYIPTGSLFI